MVKAQPAQKERKPKCKERGINNPLSFSLKQKKANSNNIESANFAIPHHQSANFTILNPPNLPLNYNYIVVPTNADELYLMALNVTHASLNVKDLLKGEFYFFIFFLMLFKNIIFFFDNRQTFIFILK